MVQLHEKLYLKASSKIVPSYMIIYTQANMQLQVQNFRKSKSCV